MGLNKNRIELESPREVFRRTLKLISCAQDFSDLILGRCIAGVDCDLLLELVECSIILIILLVQKKDHPNSVMEMRSPSVQLESLPVLDERLGRTVLSLQCLS